MCLILALELLPVGELKCLVHVQFLAIFVARSLLYQACEERLAMQELLIGISGTKSTFMGH